MNHPSEKIPGSTHPIAVEELQTQSVFRHLLTAMAYPGTIHTVCPNARTPEPLAAAAAAVATCLVDHEISVWLDRELSVEKVTAYLTIQCACMFTTREQEADFAFMIARDELHDLAQFNHGDHGSPDKSTTAVIQVNSIEEGTDIRLEGPGIRETGCLRISGLPGRFWQWRKDMQRGFPLGIDLIFVSGKCLVALPRSIEIDF